MATNEKLIKKLRRLVDAGGPAALQSDAASDLSAAGNALTTRSGRRRGGRTGLQAVNETFTSIANGTSPNSHNLFLISPTLIPVDFSKQTSHSGSKSAGRKEIAPPSSLLPEPLAVLGVPQVLQDNQHILDHGWESSDDEEQIERRREAIRRRTAAAAAAEATARAVAAERRAQETDSEEDDAFSWFGSDNDNDDEVDPPNRTKQPVGGDTTSEDEGYERDDEKERAQGSDTADEDEDGVTIERTVIVTTSINIPSGAFKGRLPPIGSFAGSPLLSASKPSSPVTRPQTPLRVASPAPELSVGRSGWGAAESSVPLPSMLRKRSSEGPYPDAKRAKPTVRLKVRAPAQPAPVLRPPVDGDETEEDDIE